jgi:hypothetical protein
MTGRGVAESIVEKAALAWLKAFGWRIAHGLDIVPGTVTKTVGYGTETCIWAKRQSTLRFFLVL